MYYLLIFLTLCLSSCAQATIGVNEYRLSPSGFVPPAGKTLVFIGQDKKTIQAYRRDIRLMPAGWVFYTSIQEIDGIEQEADYGGGIQHARFIANTYPHALLQAGLYMVGALEDVIQGKYDDHIAELGARLKAFERPVYLRIGYEFDSPDNDYQPGAYIRAFRYIVDKFRQQGVTNVAFVWHSYANMPDVPVMAWYPGDAYVDWFAVSYFVPVPPHLRHLKNIAQLAREHNKPLMIAEATPVKIGTTDKDVWSKWFAGFFDYIEKNDVRAICYINCNWDELKMFKAQRWGDARLQANETVKNLWVREISKPRYIFRGHVPNYHDN